MSPVPSSLPPAITYHRWPFRLGNRVLRAIEPLGRAGLDYGELRDSAREATGLNDFGDPRFEEPMRHLLEALEAAPELNPLGRHLARLSILRLLRHRLWAEDLFSRHPEILQREIRSPVVVVGMPRAGTTRLHRLLAADPRFLHLKAWESVNPVPWPGSFSAREQRKPDPRIANVEGALKAVLYLSPQIAAVHPLGAMEVEEEIGLIQHAFSTQLFEIMVRIPEFSRWLAAGDQTYAYEYMERLLKLIGWWRDDNPEATWVLKSPQHSQDLDALLAVFPDARLVCPHRDPVRVVGSCCSMAWNALVRDSDAMDPLWVGEDWLEKVCRMLRKSHRILDEVPDRQQHHVLYEDISRDWSGSMRDIYDFLGVELDASALQGMRGWLDQNKQHKHGLHKYLLSDFGLTAAEVEQRLAWYREQRAIPFELAR